MSKFNEKFKVGDKVIVTGGCYDITKIDTEGVIVGYDRDKCPLFKITKCVYNSKIGREFGLSDLHLSLLGSSNLNEKTQPKYYAEIQHQLNEDLVDKQADINKILAPDIDCGSCFYSQGEFTINGTFSIDKAIELKKWLSKMTAIPKKKAVNKLVKKKRVAKKKVIKK